jgi:outer membrane protein assembly factor BamD
MVRKVFVSAVLAGAVLASSGCHHKVQNPLANIDSKQPDRTLLETLINTYPDSECIARAKLALGDAWYNEGGKAAWQQAESEYKDFQTFFPNLPEASEAQLKIASMHYREMEKPDRDYAEAQRAADEYKLLIQTYPDSPLVPQAKQKLREVQEVLAERQYRIAHFYYLRDNLAASQARLQSLTDSYPLYSGVDEALYELGMLYEKEAASMRKQKVPEAQREKMVAQFEKKAIEAYSKIITRYPATDRVGDAKRRLEALKAPIPQPTPEAIAESKAEESSRDKVKLATKVTGNFKKHPNIALATKVGEPNLQEETVTSAPELVNDLTKQLSGAPPSNNIGVQAVGTGTGTPDANEKAPGTTDTTPAEGAAPKPAPPQMNEIQKPDPGKQSNSQTTATDGQTVAADNKAAATDSKQESSSKKKEKKGLRKLIPF